MGGAWSSCFGSLAIPASLRGRHTLAAPPPRPLPSRAPGKHPLSKVTAQGQPGAGVLVKALDGQGCRLWTDGWTDGRTGKLGGSFFSRGSRQPPAPHLAAQGAGWALVPPPPPADGHSLSDSVSYCEQSSGLGSSSQA